MMDMPHSTPFPPELDALHIPRERFFLLDAILATTPDHFHVYDRHGRCLYASPIALQTLGLSADAVLGRNWRELGLPDEEERRFAERLRLVFESGQAITAEIALPMSGTLCDYEQILSPLRDERSQVVLAVSTMRDITERKRHEQLVQQYTAEALARNKDLEAFSRTVAHDLKSPLGNIIGFAEWLDRHPDLPEIERREYIRIIVRNAIKMDAIIDELLLLAQVRKEQVELLPVDMAHLISEVQARLGPSLSTSDVTLSMPDVWPIVLGHGPWVEEIWVNYLSNALKYGCPLAAIPHVELGFDEQPDHFVRFWVRDYGPGIPAEKQANLFVAFGEHSWVRATGHGLGLSIVQLIIEKMGGQAGVESTLGQGSTFYFTLPALSA